MSFGGAAAAAAAEQMRQEEEEMTVYSPKDLAEGWEFKILRGWFRKPENLRAVLEEEKRGGWVLVEKFDDNRIRLKRPAGIKVVEEDLASGYDPYRTTVGLPNQAVIVLAVLGAYALLGLLLITTLLIFGG
jgi:hypothetical protein